MYIRLVQVNGYQFGFIISGIQYTTMTNSTAENCTPRTGETISYAFDFVKPYCIVMNACATEFLKEVNSELVLRKPFIWSFTYNEGFFANRPEKSSGTNTNYKY